MCQAALLIHSVFECCWSLEAPVAIQGTLPHPQHLCQPCPAAPAGFQPWQPSWASQQSDHCHPTPSVIMGQGLQDLGPQAGVETLGRGLRGSHVAANRVRFCFWCLVFGLVLLKASKGKKKTVSMSPLGEGGSRLFTRDTCWALSQYCFQVRATGSFLLLH